MLCNRNCTEMSKTCREREWETEVEGVVSKKEIINVRSAHKLWFEVTPFQKGKILIVTDVQLEVAKTEDHSVLTEVVLCRCYRERGPNVLNVKHDEKTSSWREANDASEL